MYSLQDGNIFVDIASRTSEYAVRIDEKRLIVTVFPEHEEHCFGLSHTGEFVIGAVAGTDSLLVKTCRDISDDSQEINMYYIDVRTDCMLLCNDCILTQSYHMPYLSVCDGTEYIIAESAVIEPYEIAEAMANSLQAFPNDILSVRLSNFTEAVAKGEDIKWNTLYSPKDIYYVNLVHVHESNLWFLETAVDETKTNIVKYELNKCIAEHVLCIENRIDKAVFNEDKLLFLYKWSSGNRRIDVYNVEGDIAFPIDYAAFEDENSEIELESILSIADDRYVIFCAGDYRGEEEGQCRVEYDIANHQFTIL